MYKHFKSQKHNKLIVSFIIIALLLIVIMNVLAGILYYFNVNGLLRSFLTDSIQKNQTQIIDYMTSSERQMNYITAQILSNDDIYNYVSSNAETTLDEQIIAKKHLSGFVSYNGMKDIFIIPKNLKNVYDSNLKKLSNSEIEITFEDKSINNIVEDFKNGIKFLTLNTILPKKTIIYTTYDFRGYYIIYYYSAQNTLNEISRPKTEDYSTAIYYKNELLMATDYTRFDSKFIKNEKSHFLNMNKNDTVITHTSGNYQIKSVVPREVLVNWSKPTLTGIWIFAGVLLVIGILLALFSAYIFQEKTKKYLTKLSEESNQNKYSNIKALITRTVRSCSILPSEQVQLNDYFKLIAYKKLYTVVIQLDHLKRLLLQNSYKDITIYMKQIKLLCEKEFSQIGTSIISDFDIDTLGIIIATDKAVNSDDLKSAIISVKNEISKHLNLTVTVTLGTEMLDCKDLAYSFFRLNQLKNYRFILGTNSLITEESEKTNEEFEYPETLEKQIISSVLIENYEEFHRLICIFIKKIECTSYETSKKCILKLVLNLIQYSPTKDNSAISVDFISEISNCDTLSECENLIKNKISKKIVKNQADNKIHSDQFIEQVEIITQREYANIDYNLSFLADELNISVVYAGQKFKKLFQKNFNVYLSEYRIKIATELLKENEYKSNDLAKLSGFASSAYFIKTF